ncbi:hypothetical protein J6590_078746 [Homalodisca vitripennis]|nr:hypothetical protein J6590_078746 [Homalodisca vitripennis]
MNEKTGEVFKGKGKMRLQRMYRRNTGAWSCMIQNDNNLDVSYNLQNMQLKTMMDEMDGL